MKRIMALTAAVSMLALFVLASQASAQDGPTATADPEYVSEAGTHTITVSGSGFGADPSITACTGFGGVMPEQELDQATSMANCPSLIPDMSNAIPAEGGSFSTSVTVDVPAEGLVLLVFTADPPDGALVLIKIGEPMDDMGDGMAAEGGVESGFGGAAGSDGNSLAVPLAATIAAVTLLGGAALVYRRNA